MRRVLQRKLLKESKDSITTIRRYESEMGRNLEVIAMEYGGPARRLKKELNTLKMTANYIGASSLSSNQVGFFYAYFAIAKRLQDGVWSYRTTDREMKYNIFVNPEIIYISETREDGWEYCPSFPNIKANVKRFEKIKVKYLDEEQKDQKKELKGFEARLFQHEMDHLRGFHILNWEVSYGDVEFIPDPDRDFPNFEKALSEYRDYITKMKKDFPQLLVDKRKLADVNIDSKHSDWNRNPKLNRVTLPGEVEIMQQLKEALQKDREIHEMEGLIVEDPLQNLI